MTASWSSVSGGDEFGVDRADEVDQPGGAQDSGLNTDRRRVLAVAVDDGSVGGLGMCGDQHMRVTAAQVFTGPAEWLRSTPQPDAVCQGAHLADIYQGILTNSEERLVEVLQIAATHPDRCY